MKFNMIASVVSMFVCVGCASTPHPVDANAANNTQKNEEPSAFGEPKTTETKPCDKATDKNCTDNFDAIGAAAATGSRYVYDTTIKAYRYLTSEDFKKSIDATEAHLKECVEAARSVEKALMDDAPKKEEKK